MTRLSPKRLDLLAADGNLLVLGGPGAGKTTMALLKAEREATPTKLKTSQRILFLSFARATIARVAEQAHGLISSESRSSLEIDTYHGFIWKLLRSHGYLMRGGASITLLPPPQAAARLSSLPDDVARRHEKRRLFDEEGLLHFDLFASVGAELLRRSTSLRRVMSAAYPTIILDEFQDTNAEEWALIQALGASSRLIALADPEQRIYEFRGADPKRIQEFTSEFKPAVFDLGTDNHRSGGRDITEFGNDLITGKNIGKNYKDVAIARYGFYAGRNLLFPLKGAVITRIKKLRKEHSDGWSLAVLVPSKRMMLNVSDYLSSELDGLPSITHDVALDAEAPALAASMLAALLQASGSTADVAQRLIADLCEYMRGRKGGAAAPSQGELELVDALGGFLKSGKIRGSKRKKIVEGAQKIAESRSQLALSGSPAEDWASVRALLEQSGVAEYVEAAEDSRYLRLLHKGSALRSSLNEMWRRYSGYPEAARAIEDALLEEHFASSTRDWRGIHVMTIHKSKGKEFTEVVIFEGAHHGRFVWTDAPNDIAQAKLALRVAATRAKERATILTPDQKPSPLLF